MPEYLAHRDQVIKTESAQRGLAGGYNQVDLQPFSVSTIFLKYSLKNNIGFKFNPLEQRRTA